MTFPKGRTPVPSALTFLSRRGSRVVILGLLFFDLCLARNIAVPGNAAPAESRHEKPYALIFGTVWGPDNRPLYGVKVLIRRADQKKAQWELYSNHNGEFAQRLPAGQADYLVWADLKGYKSPDGKQVHPGKEVQVHVEKDERVDIGLHLK